jgi:hypothetical protein
MISGPRYGSTSELQRAMDATRSRARRQYTSPVTLFPARKEMCTHLEVGPAKFRITRFRPGNTCRSSVLYIAKHDNATRGVVRERWQVPPRLWRPGLTHHYQARGLATIPSTESRPPIRQQKRNPQIEPKPRATILRPKGMVAFMDDMIIEVLLAQLRPFSVCPTWA